MCVACLPLPCFQCRKKQREGKCQINKFTAPYTLSLVTQFLRNAFFEVRHFISQTEDNQHAEEYSFRL